MCGTLSAAFISLLYAEKYEITHGRLNETIYSISAIAPIHSYRIPNFLSLGDETNVLEGN